MRRLSLPRRICFFVLLTCAAFLVVLFIQTIREGGGKSALVAPPNARPLVGTWLGKHGVLDLRPDGTGRSRSIKYPVKEIQYFEWSVEDGRLVVEMAAEPQEHVRRIRQSILGTTTLRFDITTTSPTESLAKILSPWPIERPVDCTRRVNRALTGGELAALRRSVQRGTLW